MLRYSLRPAAACPGLDPGAFGSGVPPSQSALHNLPALVTFSEVPVVPDASGKFDLPDEAATVALAQRLAPALLDGGVLFLRGELGTGKTTFARALLRGLGVGERVKSPTYSLLERYAVNGRDAFHLDLYRIADPGELEWLGLDELDAKGSIVLVEWPERGHDALPLPDLEVTLEYAGAGRRGALFPATLRGRDWMAGLEEATGGNGK